MSPGKAGDSVLLTPPTYNDDYVGDDDGDNDDDAVDADDDYLPVQNHGGRLELNLGFRVVGFMDVNDRQY